MSKKDYIAIARILKANYDVSNKSTRLVLRDITDQFCQYFKAANTSFDRQKFIAAVITAN